LFPSFTKAKAIIMVVMADGEAFVETVLFKGLSPRKQACACHGSHWAWPKTLTAKTLGVTRLEFVGMPYVATWTYGDTEMLNRSVVVEKLGTHGTDIGVDRLCQHSIEPSPV
jgi:hypothetical protein